jgi:hypothetical protein
MKIHVLRIKGRFQKFSFVSVHAPMEAKCEVEKGQLYKQLKSIYIQHPSYDIKIIICDFNASWKKGLG